MHLPLGGKWGLEPQVFAGYVRYEEQSGPTPDDTRHRHGFQGKAAATMLYRFSEQTVLTLIIGVQLDELGFGGGGAQFVTYF
jgi:hypothetical protein